MECRMKDCPGTYEERKILHSERHKDKTVFIDNVPALVCRVCGDTLLSLETVRRIEGLLHSKEPPVKHRPVYEFDQKRPVQTS
jgi:YgiT-type zinc finger domain-containing protein